MALLWYTESNVTATTRNSKTNRVYLLLLLLQDNPSCLF
jgi:hypothetical protein